MKFARITGEKMANTNKTRSGDYRSDAFSEYGMACDKCGWYPKTAKQEGNLHVHHIKPISEGGLDDVDNLRVLCKDCHMNLHSGSEFDVNKVREYSRIFTEEIDHKKKEHMGDARRRVNKDSVFIEGDEPDGEYYVEGLLGGDHYDHYKVDTTANYLDMCSCYDHKFGTVRAVNVCTHVLAAALWRCVTEDPGEEAARRIARSLNRDASGYVEHKEAVFEAHDKLSSETGYNDSLMKRGRAQALWMSETGDGWYCYGGKCEGATVTIEGSRGYVCSDCDEDYPPCPGHMGAYILNHADDGVIQRNIQ